MKQRYVWVVVLLVVLGLVTSCGTNIKKKNIDGSPIWTTEIPKSNKYIYGIGKARLTLDANSEQAADTHARSALSKQIESTLHEFNTLYATDTEGVALQAYEQLVIEVVNLTLKQVTLEQRWKASDGTIWSLVSFPVKQIPTLYTGSAKEHVSGKIDAEKLGKEVAQYLQKTGYDLSE